MARFSLLPHDQTFFDLFVEAGKNSVHSAQLLDRLMREWPDAGTLHQEVVEAEHRGDKVTHEIIKRLNTTFVTPIDREDIYGLATQLDDIVDFTEEAADFLGLYQVEAPMDQAGALTGVLVRSCEALAEGLENEGDRISRDAVAALFTDAIDPMVVIRWKDIFGVLEEAIDATENAAQILEGIVIKNS